MNEVTPLSVALNALVAGLTAIVAFVAISSLLALVGIL